MEESGNDYTSAEHGALMGRRLRVKRHIHRMVALVCAVVFSLLQVISASAEYVSHNPLIEPQKVPSVKTQQRYTNILLLGIDFGFWEYRGSGSKFKKTLEDCHTDAIMVVSINMTTNEVNLISLPRDTITYVPGVKGIYKLNGAFNCAETLEEGFDRICDAASWVLGGIPIDHYCAVDMEAMIALGDFIGGVDMELEMGYTGHSGRGYNKGMQHLDGLGITDYVRARTNATVNGHDIGRTGRQRQTMTAIFNKIRDNAGLLKSGWDFANSGEINFFTDMSLGKVLNLANKVQSSESIGSHVITGKYRGIFGWNFTFTDQVNRIEVIKNVFGVEVAEIPYVSYDYMEWLAAEGMHAAQNISVADKILEYGTSLSQLTAEQQTALDALQAAKDDAVEAFEMAADSMEADDQRVMVEQRRKLVETGRTAYELLGNPSLGSMWQSGEFWYNDLNVNEYQFSWQ